jgi:hypothetical protein
MKKTNKDLMGTSFYGVTIKCSYNDLVNVLGEPIIQDNTGQDKTNFEWEMETEDGDGFTVYDWKEYRSINQDEKIEWHIGGKDKNITLQAKQEIVNAIRNK